MILFRIRLGKSGVDKSPEEKKDVVACGIARLVGCVSCILNIYYKFMVIEINVWII